MTSLDAQVVVHRDGFRLDASLAVAAGEVVAVMGPSGAGKSTLLAVLAGLVGLDAGHVRLGDRTLDRAPHMRTAPHRRGAVLLGQDARLFPHLSARDNVAFGLRARGMGRADAAARADTWLDRVGLAELAGRHPSALSGGQQQRVALARALATTPAVLLLDEPLTSLDTETAGDVRALLREQLDATGTTAVVATHDAVDAVALAGRLMVLEAGRVTQSGPVRDVLAHPATRFVAAVAGLNRVVGAVTGGVWRCGELVLRAPDARDSSAIAAVFRPADVELAGAAPPGAVAHGDGDWTARITRLEPTPAGVRVRTAEPDVAVDVAADRVAALGLRAGSWLRLRVAPADVRLVPARRAMPPGRASASGGLP
jgi:molybdate transport system ATP-binding protein